MSARAWVRRRNKGGFDRLMRRLDKKLERRVKAGDPLPIVVRVRSMSMTATLALRELPPPREYTLEEEW